MATGSGITLVETLEADIATPATNKQTLFVDSTLGTPSLALKDDTGTVTPVSGGGTVTHSAGDLTASAVIVGNGGGDLKALASLGTATTVLHGNAAGLPTYGAVSLTADVSGDLPFASFVQATAASKLVGRGSAAGAGDFQEVSLGSGLSMSGTTLSASGSGGTVTTTGSPASGNLTAFSGASSITNGDLSGDVTTSGTLVTTLAANQKIAGIVFVIDGSGSAITTGVKGFLQIPFACTITAWTILSSDPAATSGSIVIDIWKDTLANYPPTVADTITAAAKPTVTTATNATSSTLTGWVTSISAGDVLGFKVDSAATVLQVTLQLSVVKT